MAIVMYAIELGDEIIGSTYELEQIKIHLVDRDLSGFHQNAGFARILTEDQRTVVIEALDDWLDGIIRTKRDLEGEELEFHEQYCKEVATVLEAIRD